jgi:hypothetical protein
MITWSTFWLAWMVVTVTAGSAVAVVCLVGGLFDLVQFIGDLKALMRGEDDNQ